MGIRQIRACTDVAPVSLRIPPYIGEGFGAEICLLISACASVDIRKLVLSYSRNRAHIQRFERERNFSDEAVLFVFYRRWIYLRIDFLFYGRTTCWGRFATRWFHYDVVCMCWGEVTLQCISSGEIGMGSGELLSKYGGAILTAWKNPTALVVSTNCLPLIHLDTECDRGLKISLDIDQPVTTQNWQTTRIWRHIAPMSCYWYYWYQSSVPHQVSEKPQYELFIFSTCMRSRCIKYR